MFPVSAARQHAKLTVSAGVTDVTSHASPGSFFLDANQQ
jgi:hypothetical protein